MATESIDTSVTPMTSEQREEAALQLVNRFSLWAGAGGLIPLPLIDVVAVGGVQFQMLRKLSKIYGVPFTENRGNSIVASVAGALISASSQNHHDDRWQLDQGDTRHRNGSRRPDHASVLRRCYLCDG